MVIRGAIRSRCRGAIAPAASGRRRGVVLVLLTLAVLTLLAMAALGIDVGRMYIASSWAQAIADGAAVAAAQRLPDEAAARAAAGDVVSANSPAAFGEVICDTAGDDVVIYQPGDTVEGWGQLGPSAWAAEVRCRVRIPMTFARVIGLQFSAPLGRAVAVRAPAGKAAIVPMWVPDGDYAYGERVELLHTFHGSCGCNCGCNCCCRCRHCSHSGGRSGGGGGMGRGGRTNRGGSHGGGHGSGNSDFIPGNFGWLDPPSPEIDFFALLRGDPIPPHLLPEAMVSVGQELSGRPGLRIGQVRSAFYQRLQRAEQPPFTNDTWQDFHPGNPRVMVLPLVEYVGGHGTNATYRVVRFGAFWLEEVYFQGQHSRIIGRFIRMLDESAYPDPDAPDGGVYAVALVR